MHVISLSIPGLLLIQPKIFMDSRGSFFESYQNDLYQQAGIEVNFVQDNIAFSKSGVVRGLHYQENPAQAKLVSVVYGTIWDVAVDIRPDSPTYGQWAAEELSAETGKQLFIPEGFAHGYCTLTPEARVHYKVSGLYSPQGKRSIRWNDPNLAIPWPITNPIVSDFDASAPFFSSLPCVSV